MPTTVDKKYLDLEGLQKLVQKKAVLVHPTVQAQNLGAWRFSVDANGHITGTDVLRASDLGLGSAMHFVGISTTDPKAAAGATVSDVNTWEKGDVVIFKRSGEAGYEEYINLTGTNASASTPNDNWELLGDADSYSIKGHTHSVTVTVPANSYVTAVNDTTIGLSLASTTASVVKSYPGTQSNLVTTSIAGVSGSTVASKATAGTAKDIAKVGTAVTYGTANPGTEVTGIAKRAASQTTVGNANIATTATTVVTGISNVYQASYGGETGTDAETLVLSLVTPSTTSIHGAVSSDTKIYGCGDTVSIIPAAASSLTLTPAASNGQITPYTFADITVPLAASATTVATGAVALNASGDAVLVGLGSPTTATVLTASSITTGASGITVTTGTTVTKNSANTLSGTAAASTN